MIFVAVYGPPFVIFMAPALINGFPLVYSDSGTYLVTAIIGRIPPDRPIYYSLFLLPLHWRTNLWLPIAAQAAITIAVLDIFLRRTCPALSRFQLALQLCCLAGLTSLPFFASQIMPDIFTPLMILSLCILIFRPLDVTAGERLFLYAVFLASLCFHQANFLLAIMTLVFALPCRWLFDGGWNRIVRQSLAPGSLLVLGMGLLLMPNYLVHHELVIARGNGIFLLAKLLDDGPGLDYLEAKCRIQRYSICSQVPAIRQHQEAVSSMQTSTSTMTWFLWSGPREAAGDWDGLAPYASSVALTAILDEPGRFVLASLRGFAHQLVLFGTGDGLVVYGPNTLISLVLRNFFPSDVNQSYLTSLQQTGRLNLAIISDLHKMIVIISLLLIMSLIVDVLRSERTLGAIASTLLFALIANAAITGALSDPIDRYQSRISGLVVVAAMTLVYASRFRRPNDKNLAQST